MAWVDVRADGGVQVRQILVLPNMPAYAAESRFRLVREGAALCGVFDETHLAGYQIVSSRALYAPVKDRRLTLIFRETLVATMLNRKSVPITTLAPTMRSARRSAPSTARSRAN